MLSLGVVAIIIIASLTLPTILLLVSMREETRYYTEEGEKNEKN